MQSAYAYGLALPSCRVICVHQRSNDRRLITLTVALERLEAVASFQETLLPWYDLCRLSTWGPEESQQFTFNHAALGIKSA